MRRTLLLVSLLTLGLLAAQPVHTAKAQVLSLAPSSLDFGDLPAHSLSAAQTLTFANTTATPIELTNVSLVSLNVPPSAGDATYFVFADLENPESCLWRSLGPDARWTRLNPGEACTVSVRFNPSGGAFGTPRAYTGELSVSYTTSGGSPETSTASLSGSSTELMACDPDIAPPDKQSNVNVNVNITTSTSEVGSTRGAGSPPPVEIGQATVFRETLTAVTGCGNATPYLGDPDDYSTWIASGSHDVIVTVAQKTVTVQYFEPTPPGPGEDPGFLLLAGREITSDGPVAFAGDAHSNGKIDLKKGAPSTYDGTFTAVGDLKIDGDNTITGDALAGGKLDLKKDATVEGVAEGHAPVDPVDLPVLDFSAGGDEVKVKKDEVLMLPPGSYGKVTVEDGATLQLAHDGSSGDYFFEELVLKKETTLAADAANGPVRIHSIEKVKFEKETHVSITGAPASPSRFLVISSLGDIDVKKETRLQGTLVAGGTVKLDKDVWFQGSIAAEKIDLQKDLVLLHHDAPDVPVAAATSAGKSNGTSLEQVAREEVPGGYALGANYPNPFNPATTIDFELPEADVVRLVVYDVMGREVARLVDGSLPAGQHTVRFDASRLASGLYLYRIQAGVFTATRHMMLMK